MSQREDTNRRLDAWMQLAMIVLDERGMIQHGADGSVYLRDQRGTIIGAGMLTFGHHPNLAHALAAFSAALSPPDQVH